MQGSHTLRRQLVLWGVVLTWAVGGVVGLEGWLLLTLTARGEAEARVRDAVRVARRMVDQELDRLTPGGSGVVEVPAAEATRRGGVRAAPGGRALGR